MNSKYLFFIIGAIACFVQSANAIQCYRCFPDRNDPNCDRKTEIDCNHVSPPPTYQQQQPQAPNWQSGGSGYQQQNWQQSNNAYNNNNQIPEGCVKRTYKTYEGQILVERDCFFGDVRNQTSGCIPISRPGIGMQQQCLVCVKDRCNSSTTILPKFTTTMFAVILMAFFGKLFIF